jgi:beta-glucosidase-like glycosyl hydrolase
MCGYNKINNVWACEDPATLSLLRDQLQWDGWVMSDWGGTHSTSAAANAGLDMEMPGKNDLIDLARHGDPRYVWPCLCARLLSLLSSCVDTCV